MSNPREVMQKIRRRQQAGQPTANAPRTPAPMPASPVQPVAPIPRVSPAPVQSTSPAPAPVAPVQPNPPSADQPAARPIPHSGHALYSELMRSHDRMGTRHLKK